ncbi:hypothetical protein NS230_09990 [Methylobacterium indicum]|nr:hypothetical protein NS230_09990 [Methylobacterium indicum]
MTDLPTMGNLVGMKLIAYMAEHKLDDETFASQLEDCTAHAVRKWKYGQREPDASTIVKIQEITGGAVNVEDWAQQAREVAAGLKPSKLHKSSAPQVSA